MDRIYINLILIQNNFMNVKFNRNKEYQDQIKLLVIYLFQDYYKDIKIKINKNKRVNKNKVIGILYL